MNLGPIITCLLSTIIVRQQNRLFSLNLALQSKNLVFYFINLWDEDVKKLLDDTLSFLGIVR